MATVLDIIQSAYRKIGVYSSGEEMSADEAHEGLEALTDMVSAWSNESLLIPSVSLVSKVLVPGERMYTIGNYPDPLPDPLPDTHINIARPIQYLSVYLQDGAKIDWPLTKLGAQSYDVISNKTCTSKPSRYYVREGWPMDHFYFDSQPDAAYTLFMQVRLPLSEMLLTAELDDAVDVPPGYRRLLIYNLALELSSENGKQADQLIMAIAAKTLKGIKRKNWQPLYSKVDGALLGRAGGTYLISQGP